VVGAALACSTLAQPADARRIAEAWSAAVSAGDAAAYLATVDPEHVRYDGKLVSTDARPHVFDAADEARATSALFASARVVGGAATVVEVAGDDAVVALKLEVADDFVKGGGWRFRYDVGSGVRLRTRVRDGARRIVAIEEHVTGSGVVGSLALSKYLHSETLYEVRTTLTRVSATREVELSTLVDRRGRRPALLIRMTIDADKSPLGTPTPDVHRVVLDARGHEVANVEENED
jgi:hypothetical protein